MEESLTYLKEQFELPDVDVRSYSPLVLAYIGDGIYELVIRTAVVGQGNRQANALHKKTSTYVKASAQAAMMEAILEDLTEEELAVYKRGRNAKTVSMAKHATMHDYRHATGFEAQIGLTEEGAYKLVIPNKEVREVYKLQIQEWFEKSLFSNVDQLQSFWKSFAEGNTEEIEKYLNKVLSNSISVFDTKGRNEEKESSYHNLLTGVLTGNADWLVKSNVEAGEGFADIIVETDDPDAGIITELKYTRDTKEMEQACKKAIAQIKDRRYQEYLLNDERRDILLYGIAFCKKRCKVIAEKMMEESFVQ